MISLVSTGFSKSRIQFDVSQTQSQISGCIKNLKIRWDFPASACSLRSTFDSVMAFPVLFSRSKSIFYPIFTGENPPKHREWLQKISRNLKLLYAARPWSLFAHENHSSEGILRSLSKSLQLALVRLLQSQIFWIIYFGISAGYVQPQCEIWLRAVTYFPPVLFSQGNHGSANHSILLKFVSKLFHFSPKYK